MVESEIEIWSEGARLSGFAPYLESYIAKAKDRIEAKALKLLEAGTLTPELALYAWMEVSIYRKVLMQFQQRVRLGISAGTNAAEQGKL